MFIEVTDRISERKARLRTSDVMAVVQVDSDGCAVFMRGSDNEGAFSIAETVEAFTQRLEAAERSASEDVVSVDEAERRAHAIDIHDHVVKSAIDIVSRYVDALPISAGFRQHGREIINRIRALTPEPTNVVDEAMTAEGGHLIVVRSEDCGGGVTWHRVYVNDVRIEGWERADVAMKMRDRIVDALAAGRKAETA